MRNGGFLCHAPRRSQVAAAANGNPDATGHCNDRLPAAQDADPQFLGESILGAAWRGLAAYAFKNVQFDNEKVVAGDDNTYDKGLLRRKDLEHRAYYAKGAGHRHSGP